MWDSLFYGRLKRVHFIGIGGSGMSGIAEVLLNVGLDVHGSDLSASEVTSRLSSLGAVVHIGHRKENLNGADVVIVSSAVDETNPEIVFAHENSIPVIPRAEMLAELMRLRHGIAIAGSHGKTTTTSLVAAVLQKAELDPTIIIGGRLNHLGANAKLGAGHFMVAEADESDGSFLRLSPSISVITNIDPEHLDYWKGGLAQIKEKFTEFANKIPFFGLLVACVDDDNVRDILPNIKRRVASYGIDHEAQFMASEIEYDGMKTHFAVTRRGVSLGRVTLPLTGRHNVLNALAAIAVAFELRVDLESIFSGLADFSGVQRRFTLVGEEKGVTVIDDYGHHPTEIKAVLKAARNTFVKRRLVVLFQPHRYSRTHHLFDDFCTAFEDCDVLILTDVYAAGENPIEGADAHSLCKKISSKGCEIQYGGSLEVATALCIKEIRPDDVVITLGAGSITRSAKTILQALKND